MEFRKWKVTDSRVIRFSKNIKTILCFSMNKPTNDIILIVEYYENDLLKKRLIYLYLK